MNEHNHLILPRLHQPEGKCEDSQIWRCWRKDGPASSLPCLDPSQKADDDAVS